LTAESDQLFSRELCEEAISLARVLVDLTGRENVANRECCSLLALMLLLHSRAETRQDDGGMPVLLPDQDRSRWNASLIEEGLSLLHHAGSLEEAGSYQLQAAVQAMHALASDAAETDWRAIDRLYLRLYRLESGPVVAVNGVVAMGMWRGPVPALAALDALERVHGESLAHYPWLFLARAHFAEIAGDGETARIALEKARALSSNRAERAFFTRRIEKLCEPEACRGAEIS
ncbi:MAG TPA: DUF6596 domain-containing protein, partial [Spirochaetia bacterium]|nr:DUF6596 domain-containing protein [Spirochaetia bacterium]